MARPFPALRRFEASGLAVTRAGRQVLGGVAFSLGAGGALLLAGRNGAGKTTLLRALAGLALPSAGTLLWNGADALADRALHATRLAFLGHADAIKPGLTLHENLRLAARLAGLGDAAIGAALDAVGLAPLAHAPSARLSAGQRRRLALARVFLAARPLLLLDEPATGLDAASIARLEALLAQHRASGGAVIASSHGGLVMPGAAMLVLG